MRRRPSLLLLLALGLAACGDGSGGAEGSPIGRTYLSTSVTGHELVAGTQVRIEFRNDEVAVHAGCNHLSGTLRLDGGRLHVTGVGGTEMGCDPERHAQDEWIAGFLASGPTYDLDGDRLRLESDQVVVTLRDREAVEPDRPLEGTTWLLDGLIDGDAVGSVPPAAETTLVFEEGRLDVRSCNRGSATVTVAPGTVEVAELVLTKVACGEERMAVEAHVVAVLDGRLTYAIEADRLTLTHPSGRGLSLRAA